RSSADQAAPRRADRRITDAAPGAPAPAVQRRVAANGLDRVGHDVGRDDVGAGSRRQHRREAEAASDLEDALARAHRQVAAEEERSSLGRLDSLADTEQASAPGEEEQAVVGGHLPWTRRK